MSYGADVSDQVVRLTLDGVEVAARLTGKAAERLVKLIYSIIKDQKRTKGKMRLSSMIRTGKPMKIFAINDENLMTFCKEAKKYGVMYCVLKDTDAKDGLTDIMIREEDVGKVNRIFERFDLAVVDMGELKTDIVESREQEQGKTDNESVKEDLKKEEGERDADTGIAPSKTENHMEGPNDETAPAPTDPPLPEPPPPYARLRSDRINEFLDRLEGSANQESKKELEENPTNARTERSPQSGRSSVRSRVREENDPRAGDRRLLNSAAKRPSVKKELETLSKEKSETAAVSRENVHIAPKKKKRERGRHHSHGRE